jgi:hypothetical protein
MKQKTGHEPAFYGTGDRCATPINRKCMPVQSPSFLGNMYENSISPHDAERMAGPFMHLRMPEDVGLENAGITFL